MDELLGELELAHIKDSKVGSSLIRGISGGEKKRLAIAIEMITDPQLIFLVGRER